MDPIEAVLNIRIEHHGGPAIADPAQVLAWLTPETLHINERTNTISFSACPTCPHPDECDCTDTGSFFRVVLDSADLAE